MIAVLELAVPAILGVGIVIARNTMDRGESVAFSKPGRVALLTAASLIALVTVAWAFGSSPAIGRWAELQLLWLAPALFWSSIAASIKAGSPHESRTARAVRGSLRFMAWFALGTGLSWLTSLLLVQWMALQPRPIEWPVQTTIPVGPWTEMFLPALTTFHGRMQGWVWNRVVLCALAAVIFVFGSRSVAGVDGKRAANARGGQHPFLVAGFGAVAMALAVLASWGATSCRTWRHGLCEGRLEVPVNANSPAVSSIDVSYMIEPAAAAEVPHGVIVAAIGGPSSASSMRSALFAALGEIGDAYDILISDYRGFGRSHPVGCKDVDVGPATEASVEVCMRRLGPLANQLNARRAADDLEAVRKHLGIDRLDIYGESYGTFYAQTYAQLYPQSVRSMILDSALPLRADADVTFVASQLSGENPLQHFCKPRNECGSEAQLVPAWREAVAAARAGRSGPTAVDLAVIHVFSIWPEVDLGRRVALLRPQEERAAALLELSEKLRAQVAGMRADPMSTLFAAPSAAMAYACNDYPMPFSWSDAPRAREQAARSYATHAFAADIAPFTWAEIDTALRETNGLRVNSFRYEACLYWSYQDVVPAAYGAAPPIHTLLISGSMDTTTTPEMALMIARQWPAARILSVSDGDHFVLNGPKSTCARAAAIEFLRDPAGNSPARC